MPIKTYQIEKGKQKDIDTKLIKIILQLFLPILLSTKYTIFALLNTKLNWKERHNWISVYFKLSKTDDHFPVATEKMVELTLSEEICLKLRLFTKIFGKTITNSKVKVFWLIHTSLKTFDFNITNFPNEPANLLLQQKLTSSVLPKIEIDNLPKFCFHFLFAIREKIRN